MATVDTASSCALYPATHSNIFSSTSGIQPYVIILIAFLCFCFMIAFIITIVDYEKLKNQTTRPTWLGPGPSISTLERYQFAAVSTDSDMCGPIGTYMMSARGGSAIDGAIAVQLCNGLTNMQSSGISGGSFMLFYNRNGTVSSLDFRDVAPLDATQNMFSNNASLSLRGGLAVTVPSELSGYWEAHQRFGGRLQWKELFEPVIIMCEKGFRISTELGTRIKGKENEIRASPGLSAILVNNATGELLTTGDIVRDPQLAETFRTIANEPLALYNGSLAADVAKEVQDAKGIIRKEDLEKYKPTSPDTIRAVLPNSKFVVYGLRPPSSGVIVTYMLRIMDGYKVSADVKRSLSSYSLFYHRLVETFKFAYAKRSALGDENFIRANISQLMKNLTSQSYADHTRSLISDDRTHDVRYYGPSFDWKEDHGTSHLSLISPDGDAVSMTSTINTRFGSLVRGLKTGIIYNNGMNDFSWPGVSNTFELPPSPSNFIEPGKRPMSSMAPTIITYSNGTVALIVGASGGSQITTRIAYIAMRVLFLGESVKEAIDAPRIHHQLVPNVVSLDKDFPISVANDLKKKGHKIVVGKTSSVSQGVHLKDGVIFANADYRKGGRPSGQ